MFSGWLRSAALAAALTAGLTACAPKSKAQAPAVSPAAGQAFLAANAKAPGVVVLPDGLQYKVVKSGPADGAHPGPYDPVKVNYEGALIDGKVFDSSFKRGQPAVFDSVQGLIPAWTEALPLMRPGDEWTLYVPAELGYGAEGAGDDIPPNSVLVFRIQLLDVLK